MFESNQKLPRREHVVDDAESSDIPLTFVERLRLEGIDPAKDLINKDYSGRDFQNSNVDGWDFSGAKLVNADLSEVTNIGMAIWDNTNLDGAKLPPGVEMDDLESPREK